MSEPGEVNDYGLGMSAEEASNQGIPEPSETDDAPDDDGHDINAYEAPPEVPSDLMPQPENLEYSDPSARVEGVAYSDEFPGEES